MNERIKLSFGGAQAEIQPAGAQIASFKGADGREVIWQADPAVWPQHAPILFPVCGTVKDDTTKIGGQSYPMRKHGFTRTAPFTVAKQGDDFVELVLTPFEDSRTMYPFDFVLHVTYTIAPRGFTTTFLVENHSDKVMPFCIGGHPGFNCPMEDNATFEDYQLEFAEVEDGENSLAPGGGLVSGTEYLPGFHHANVLPLNHGLFDERDALIFAGLKSRSVKLVHRTSGKGLQFDFPKMEVLAVWSKPGANADYLCLEPWHGMPERVGESGNLEDKPYATLLEPGRCYKTWFTTTIIK